jgi:hypothetical protein
MLILEILNKIMRAKQSVKEWHDLNQIEKLDIKDGHEKKCI